MTKTRSKILALLDTSPKPILADGAMGTILHARGIGFDRCFDELNLTDPTLVGEIHQAYIQAGSQIIYTNTFGANRYKLAEHGLESKVVEINQAGVELARRVVAASFKEVWVAGDIGPLGVHLVPYGRVQVEDAKAAFIEQIAALCDAGVDMLVIETFSDMDEIREAVTATRHYYDLPIIASATFTRDDETGCSRGAFPRQTECWLAGTGWWTRDVFRWTGLFWWLCQDLCGLGHQHSWGLLRYYPRAHCSNACCQRGHATHSGARSFPC
jgi:methionine synthase I (cobalamin-dependent)